MSSQKKKKKKKKREREIEWVREIRRSDIFESDSLLSALLLSFLLNDHPSFYHPKKERKKKVY
jgi:hypothetical protein